MCWCKLLINGKAVGKLNNKKNVWSLPNKNWDHATCIMLMSNQGKIHGHHDFRFTNAYTFGWSMGLANHHWTWIIIGLIIFIACSLPHGIWKCLKLVSVDIRLIIRVNLWFKASFYISRKIAHAAIWFHVPCSRLISCNLLRHVKWHT
jgi:hypothetical protein